jgi:tetratricopeptide (TPR) repeat protein
MKMNNRNEMHSYSLKHKNHDVLNFRFCVYTICLILLPFQLLTSFTEIAYAKSTTEVSEGSSKGSFLKELDNNNLRKMWRAGISVTEGKDDRQSKDKLKRAIEQLRSVNLSPQKHVPEPVVGPIKIQHPEVSDKPDQPEPNETLPSTNVPEKEDTKETESKLPHDTITERTKQILKDLSEQPDKVENPFELGEVLFLSGNLKEAAVFYCEALKRTSTEDTDSIHDRAWILFQVGNCLRHDDIPEAAKFYGQLITEYPNSPWTALAQVQAKLIDWQQKDQPQKLIAESRP